MRVPSILFAILLTAGSVCADSYTHMALPGDCFAPEWSTAEPSLAKVGGTDDTWSGTIAITRSSGAFKIAANNSWDINWGSASFNRTPAVIGPLTRSGSDITFSDLPIGTYRFTFNTATLLFSVEPVTPAPPAVQSVQLLGNFNRYGELEAGHLTQSSADANEWSITNLTVSTLPDACQFRVTLSDGSTSDWGAATTISIPVQEGTSVTTSIPGSTAFILQAPAGTFDLTLNTASNTFTITRTAYSSGSAFIALQGKFAGNATVSVNMQPVGGGLWRSEHWLPALQNGANATSLRFVGCDAGGFPHRYWTSTNPATLSAGSGPATGIVIPSDALGALQLINSSAGRHQIIFNEYTGEFSYSRIYSVDDGMNLLENPSFEETEEAEGQISPSTWSRWPRTDFIRAVDHTNYFIHSGSRAAAIQRLYNDWEDYAGFDQDIGVSSHTGRILRVSTFARSVGIINPSLVEIQVTWRNSTNDLSIDSQRILDLSDLWQSYKLEVEVPTNATSAHVVFRVSGFNGGTGAVLFDDVEARIVAGQTQNFDAWGNIPAYRRIANDWIASNAKTIRNIPEEAIYGDLIFAKYIEGSDNNKALEIFNGTPGDIPLSGYYIDQYSNGSTTPTATIPLSGTVNSLHSIVLARTDNGAATPPDLQIRSKATIKDDRLTFNGDDVLVLRHGATILDRIGTVSSEAVGAFWTLSAKDHTLTRRSTVTNGLTTAITDEFPLNEWTITEKDDFSDLGSHSFTDIADTEYMPSGYSLEMTLNTHLISGELSDGVGAVSFYYRGEDKAGDPGRLVLETTSTPGADVNPTNATWTIQETITLNPTGRFVYVLSDISDPTALFLRFRHEAAASSPTRVRLDDIIIESYTPIKRIQKFTGWTQTNSGTYTKDGWTIENAAIALTSGVGESEAAHLTTPESAVMSPIFEGGSGVTTFWAALDPEDGSSARLIVEYSTDGGTNWTESGVNLSITTNIGVNLSAYLYVDDESRVRIRLADESSGAIYIDDIRVEMPVYYPNQNFNAWPTSTTFWHGWELYNGGSSSLRAYDGNSARMASSINNVDLRAWVKSCYIPKGIYSISFVGARDVAGSGTALQYTLQLSEDGQTWVNQTVFTFPGQDRPAQFDEFSFALADTNTVYHYARLLHTAGGHIALIDDIAIRDLTQMPRVSATTSMAPTPPIATDLLTLTASVSAHNDVSILSVTGYYTIDGTTNTVAMSLAYYGTYQSTQFGPYPEGQAIPYWAEVTYSGIGVGGGSGLGTNTIRSAIRTNAISSVQPGSVWINEVFYAPHADDELDFTWWIVTEDHEYIEICGLAGTDLSGWVIEFAFGREADIIKNGNLATYASYTISDGMILEGTSTNGTHGFYVLGDQQLKNAGENVNDILNTTVPTVIDEWGEMNHNHIHNGVGVVRLLDHFGNLVHAISYGDYDIGGAEYTHKSQETGYTETNSIGLSGTGSGEGDFSWDKGGMTIGRENDGQILEQGTITVLNTWHVQDRLVTPSSPLVSAFYMLDPANAAMWNDIQIAFGFNTTETTSPSGILYYRNQKTAQWSTLNMSLLEASRDANGFAYVTAIIPAYKYPRLDTISYFIQVNPNKSGVETAYLAYINGSYTNLLDIANAQANPFTYTLPFVDEIHLTEIDVDTNGTIWLTSVGNDPVYPITNFRVRSTTAITNPPETWATNETATSTFVGDEASGTNLFKVYPEDDATRFYRLDLLWP